jgi:hypothetical protein
MPWRATRRRAPEPLLALVIAAAIVLLLLCWDRCNESGALIAMYRATPSRVDQLVKWHGYSGCERVIGESEPGNPDRQMCELASEVLALRQELETERSENEILRRALLVARKPDHEIELRPIVAR